MDNIILSFEQISNKLQSYNIPNISQKCDISREVLIDLRDRRKTNFNLNTLIRVSNFLIKNEVLEDEIITENFIIEFLKDKHLPRMAKKSGLYYPRLLKIREKRVEVGRYRDILARFIKMQTKIDFSNAMKV